MTRRAGRLLLGLPVLALVAWAALWLSPLGLCVWHDHIYSEEGGPTLVAGCLYWTGSAVIERYYYQGEGCPRFAYVGYHPTNDNWDEKKLPWAN